MINLKIRLKNPVFIFQFIVSLVTPIVAYLGINLTDITTFSKLGEVVVNAISNPYVIVLIITSITNAMNDPTTTGFKDSDRVQNYNEIKK